MSKGKGQFLSALLFGSFAMTSAYLEVDGPQSFQIQEVVELKVNKLTSSKNLFPIDYYQLPFCKPYGSIEMFSENLGQFLAGDRIHNSPYRIGMLEDMFCEQLCISNLGYQESNRFARAIQMGYHNNWSLDNLPAANKMENDKEVVTRYWHGFPIGYVEAETGKTYVNNHVNIEIQYHRVEDEIDKYRIVKFTAQPFSINYAFEPVEEKENEMDIYDDDHFDDNINSYDFYDFKVAKIWNAMDSCTQNTISHTSYEMVNKYNNMVHNQEPQLARGKVLFTYDVIWIENTETRWTSRWDIYLSMDDATPPRIHWFSITNSLMILSFFSAIIASLLIRNLRNSRERYGRLVEIENGELAEDFEERCGWELVHGDVFRPPSFSPLVLASLCGTGAQLLCTACLILLFACFGLLTPANRGSLLTALISLYVLMGGVSGYVTARFNKTFGGDKHMHTKGTVLAALGFPGLAFVFFVMMNSMASFLQSTISVPFLTVLVLLVLCLGISTPLVFFGAFIGNKQHAFKFPLKTNATPRHVPNQPWFMNIFLKLVLAGIFPFGASFIELYLIMLSMWYEQYYNTFGFVLLVFTILIIMCGEISVIFCFIELRNGNYHWWWSSFCTAGSLGLHIFFFSISYCRKMELINVASFAFFVGCMGLVSLALFLMMGFVGVVSCLWFNKTLYGFKKNH